MSIVEAVYRERISQIEFFESGNIKFGKYTPFSELSNKRIEEEKILKPSGNYVTADGLFDLMAIRTRFLTCGDETVIELALQAANAALKGETQIDAVLASTSYPIGVNLARQVSSSLELNPSYYTDIHAACSGVGRGFKEIYHQTKSAKMGVEGAYDFRGKRVLLLASEDYGSSLVDIKKEGFDADPDMNRHIFSSGAVASVFTYGEDLEVLKAKSVPMPELADQIKMPINKELAVEPYIMEEVLNSQTNRFKQKGSGVLGGVLRSVPIFHKELTNDFPEVKITIFHQGTGKMVDMLAKRVNTDVYKYMDFGNFSSASALMALMESLKDHTVNLGDTIAFEQFGAGMYYAGAVLKFNL
jgi:3-oxoacyl-[acyl-carrier-protein] synthase III